MSGHSLFHIFSLVPLLHPLKKKKEFPAGSPVQAAYCSGSEASGLTVPSLPSFFISFCPFPSSFCPQLLACPISFPFTSLHDLYSDSHFNYCSFFFSLMPVLSFVSFLLICLLPSPPQNRPQKKHPPPLRPAHEGTDRFMWSVWFCAVNYMFRHVKELYPRMALHPQIPSHNFSKALLSPSENRSAPVKGSTRFFHPLLSF